MHWISALTLDYECLLQFCVCAEEIRVCSRLPSIFMCSLFLFRSNMSLNLYSDFCDDDFQC